MLIETARRFPEKSLTGNVWRVCGADPDDPPLDIIASDEVWTFKKQ
jgi:hypothetical protein